jgi:hypothetical protein
MFGPDQRRLVDRVNDAAGAKERIQIDDTDCGRSPAVVQRRISVRPEVRRHGDRAQVHWTPRSDLGGPPLLVRRVARESGRLFGNRRRDVPQLTHVKEHDTPVLGLGAWVGRGKC